jgi:hypothetical protein
MEQFESYLEGAEGISKNAELCDVVPVDMDAKTNIYVDRDTPSVMEDAFAEYGDGLPPMDISDYFTDPLPEEPVDRIEWYDEITADADRNFYFSDMLQQQKGSCAQIALASQLWVEESKHDHIDTYLVNAGTVDIETEVWGDHAFLITANTERGTYALFDPSLKAFGQIESANDWMFSLEETQQEKIEDRGFVYAYRFPDQD